MNGYDEYKIDEYENEEVDKEHDANNDIEVIAVGQLDPDCEKTTCCVIIPEPRSFLETPFEEYTVTEGFLLLYIVMVCIAFCYHFIRRYIEW
ncbi:MAG: hypothetical protein FWD90_12300 [Defluviitaleaceae bacterium]|nr:hypothetical protein [Defluviitaleaceae bacterium]